MGIPSYYGTLIRKIPHAIQTKVPNVNTLAIDMNCMIYHVLKEPTMMAILYPGEQGRLAWERKLQDEVCSYLTHIWRSSGSPGKVYVALDGVVPYAKIKQQRFRRFKGAATPDSTEPVWDKNAITPGTQFMKSMGSRLRETGKKHGWIISDTDEPGEGEHKVLQWLLKSHLNPGGIVVYGLDADLILLCLIAGEKLGSSYPIYLLREAMAFGKLVRLEGSDNVNLCFFQIDTLRKSLERGIEWTREQFYDYVFGMSFCGNDFLPTGLSLRIRDEGHSILLSGLHDLWAKGNHLISINTDGIVRPNANGLKFFAIWMSRQEERLILQTIRRKMSTHPGENDADNLPLIEQAERPLIQNGSDNQIFMKKNWLSVYCKLALGEDSIEQRQSRVSEFWKGWCWILDYYQGRPVDLEWVYAGGYPPSWSDLVRFFELPAQDTWQIRIPLKPQEQLALVLPLSSWGLLLETTFRLLPANLPQFWPQGFRLETFGKRFGWECEPMIPMLSPGRLRFTLLKMDIQTQSLQNQ
jgi:5'-3' exonuclease